MVRLTLSNRVLVMGVAVMLGIGADSRIMAALNTSIANGGFESGTGGIWTPIGIGAPNATNPGWSGAAGGYGNGEGVWFSTGGPGTLHDNSFAPVFPAFTGVRAGSLIAHAPPPPPAANNQATIFQSLGMVDASDVGKTFFLSADMGARAFPNRSYTGDMTVRFATGANAATAIGATGIINVVTNPGLVALPPAFPLTTATASFSPAAGDIGTEIFASVHLLNFTPYGGDENQYVVDNVALSVVPEPASIALLFTFLLGVVTFTKRSR